VSLQQAEYPLTRFSHVFKEKEVLLLSVSP
jgi:hypothetical protein